MGHVHRPRGSPCPPCRLAPAPAPVAAARTFVATVLFTLQCHVGGIVRQAVAHVWLLPLGVIVCGPCVVPPCRSALPAGAESALSHGRAKFPVVCSPADGGLGRFQFAVIINRTATNVRACASVWTPACLHF